MPHQDADDEGRPLPVFPGFAEAALARRRLLKELAEHRVALGLSQTVVAARMGTSQSVVARLESGEVDARLSTVERYAAALGHRLEWRLSEGKPPLPPPEPPSRPGEPDHPEPPPEIPPPHREPPDDEPWPDRPAHDPWF